MIIAAMLWQLYVRIIVGGVEFNHRLKSRLLFNLWFNYPSINIILYSQNTQTLLFALVTLHK